MPLALPNVPGIANLAPSDEEAAQWGMAPRRPPSAPPPPPAAPPEMIASAEVDQGPPPIADAVAGGSDVNAQPVDALRGPRPSMTASATAGPEPTQSGPGLLARVARPLIRGVKAVADVPLFSVPEGSSGTTSQGPTVGDLAGDAAAAYQSDIPGYSSAARAAQKAIVNLPAMRLSPLGVMVPDESNTMNKAAASVIPVSAGDVALNAAPLAGDAADLARAGLREGAARIASTDLARNLPENILTQERAGAAVARATGREPVEGARLAQQVEGKGSLIGGAAETPPAEPAPSATATPPAGDVGAAPPAGPPHEPPAAPEGDAAATTLRNLFGIETPVPQLTRWQSTLNAIKNVVGGTPDEPIAAGAFKVLRAGRQNIEAQANRFGAVASQIVKEGGFNLDKDGRVVDLPGKPTIQDVAARLPEFEAQLSPTQLQAMRDLQQETAPFAEALKAQGVEIASRADVQDGGFYLPRGRADIEGADAATGAGGGGRVGGKKGFERSATFESMGHGLDAGYKYAEFGDAMQSYARDAGNRALDTYVGDYFKNVTDEAGNKLAETAADRVNPGLRDQVNKLRGQIASRLDTLAQQTARGGANDLAQRRVTAIYDAIEKRVQAATEKLSFAGDRITPVSPTDEAIIRAKEELSALERAQTPVRNAAKAAADTASGTWERAAGTRSDLGDLRNELNGIEGDWNQAKRIAQQTPRGQGSIHDFSGLQGYSFPDEVANAANKYLDQMKPPSGAGTAPIVVIRAVNNLLRGLRASTDLSFMGIQGLLGLGHDPGAYGQALKVGIQSMADKDALGAFLRDFDKDATTKGLPTSREWAAAGLHFGGREHEFTIGKGLGGLGEAIGSAPVIKQSNRSFGYFGDSLRPALAQAMFDNPGFMSDLRPGGEAASTLTGAERTTAMKQIADASNLLTGWSRGRFLGDFGDLAQFAPRFFQSQLELIGKAATDGSMTGDQARKALLKLAGYGTLITVGANTALGNNKESGFDYLTPLTNGSLNPNFMRIRIPGGPNGGRDVSLFGPWDSLLRGVVAAGGGDPGYLARTKASPAVQAGIDLVTGKDFNGKDVGGATVAGIKTGNANYWLHNLLPFSISGQGSQSPTSDPLGTVIGATGLKSTPMSAGEQRDAATREVGIPELQQAGVLSPGVKSLSDLGSGETAAVKRWLEQNRPELAAHYDQARRQQGGVFQAAADKADVTNKAFADYAGKLYQSLISGEETPANVLTLLQDRKNETRGEQAQIYDKTYQDAVSALPQSDIRKLEGQYFAIAGDAVKAAQDKGVKPDWTAIDQGQQRFMDNLKSQDPALATRFQKNLDQRDSIAAAPAIIKLQREVDTASKDYYALLDGEKKAKDAGTKYTGPKSADWLAQHPDVNVMRWVFYDTALHSTEAVDQALAKQGVDPETKAALGNPAFEREVKLDQFARPINETPQSEAGWRYAEAPIKWFLNDLVPQNQEAEALGAYRKPFTQLTESEKTAVANNIRTAARKEMPELDAWLVWFGREDTLQSRAASSQLQTIMSQYGNTPPKPGFEVKLAANAR